MAHEIEKKYVEKTPGGILPDSHVILCSCKEFKEKATSEKIVMERFEDHQKYPQKVMRRI